LNSLKAKWPRIGLIFFGILGIGSSLMSVVSEIRYLFISDLQKWTFFAWWIFLLKIPILIVLMVITIGYLFGRRWARSLLMVYSLPIFFYEVIKIIFYLMPTINGAWVLDTGFWEALLFLSVAVLTPIAFLLFNLQPNVKQLFETLDKNKSWTDRFPLSVLLLLMLLFQAYSQIIYFPKNNYLISYFGQSFDGWYGVIIKIIIILIFLLLARGLFFLFNKYWWFVLGFNIFLIGSTIVDVAINGFNLNAGNCIDWTYLMGVLVLLMLCKKYFQKSIAG
jgi:hypothetical protein